MYTDIYAIMDDEGIIESGTEYEIMLKWDKILDGGYDDIIGDHTGDLKLIQIKDTWNG